MKWLEFYLDNFFLVKPRDLPFGNTRRRSCKIDLLTRWGRRSGLKLNMRHSACSVVNWGFNYCDRCQSWPYVA